MPYLMRSEHGDRSGRERMFLPAALSLGRLHAEAGAGFHAPLTCNVPTSRSTSPHCSASNSPLAHPGVEG